MKGFIGTDLSNRTLSSSVFALVLEAPDGLIKCFCDLLCEVNKIPIAGKIRRRFKAIGEDEYSVVANKIPPQLSRKSVSAAKELYGVKNP